MSSHTIYTHLRIFILLPLLLIPKFLIAKTEVIKRNSTEIKKVQKISRGKQKDLPAKKKKEKVKSVKQETQKKKEKVKPVKQETQKKKEKIKPVNREIQKKKEKIRIDKLIEAIAEEFTKSHSQGVMRYINLIFFECYQKALLDSLRKANPILDPATRKNIVYPDGKISVNNLYNTFSKECGIRSLVSQFYAALQLATANNDKERIQKIQLTLQALKNKSILVREFRRDFEKVEDLLLDMLTFFAIILPDIPLKNEVTNILWPHTAIPEYLTDLEQLVTGKAESQIIKSMQENPLGVRSIRLVNLEFSTLSSLANIHMNWEIMVQLKNTIFYAFYYTVGWIPGVVESDSWKSWIGASPSPGWLGDTRGGDTTMVRLVRFVFPRVRALFSLNHPFSEVIYGGKVDLDSGGWMGNVLRFLAYGWIDFVTYRVLGFSTRTNQMYREAKAIIATYKNWLRVTNKAHTMLKALNTYRKIIRKQTKKLKKDSVLKELFKEHLALSEKFLKNKHSKRLGKIMKKHPKSLTMWEVINPFNPKSSDLLLNYKKISSMSARCNKMWRDTIASFHKLEAIVAIAQRCRLSERGVTPRTLCIPTIKTAEKPSMHYKGIYTPMLRTRNPVKNTIGLGMLKNGKHANNNIITGPNGSGKTVLIRGIAVGVLTTHSFCVFFGDAAEVTLIDKLIFSINVNDNITKDSSLMMAEIDELIKIIHRSTLNEEEAVVVLIDELAKGTPQPEGTALITASLKKMGSQFNNIIVTSTHFTEMPECAARIGYKGFTLYTTEFLSDKGFTYKIIPGRITTPASIHLLQKKKFDSEVFKEFITLLKRDPGYKKEFKKQLPDVGEGSNFMLYLILFILLALAGAITLGVARYKGYEVYNQVGQRLKKWFKKVRIKI